MDDNRKLQLMKMALEEAALSTSEDSREHPKVGAVLSNPEGEVLIRAHRGEEGGTHAEYSLIKKAREKRISLTDNSLFVTLEPCTRRSPGKIPCAVRVGSSGLKEVYIGALDPNPAIIGRGYHHLTMCGINVGLFPPHLGDELRTMNERFILKQAYLSDPIVSPDDWRDVKRGLGFGQREGILTSTLDMIASSRGPVWMFAGDTTWLREMFVGLLEAGLRDREVQILCQKPVEPQLIAAARSVGASIGVIPDDLNIRATIVDPESDKSEMIVIEKDPDLHALVYAWPFEKTVLERFQHAFNESWETARKLRGHAPSIIPIDLEFVEQALRSAIPAYREAEFSIETVDLRTVGLLSTSIELFKLRRVATLDRLQEKFASTGMGFVRGSPWGVILPIIEQQPDGSLVVIDGAHRIYSYLERGLPEQRIILVRNVGLPLPAEVVPRHEIRLTAGKLERSKRYRRYNPALFRVIRTALESAIMRAQPDLNA